MNKPRFTPDGLEIEDYGPGGHVVIVKKDEVTWRDIEPFMAGTYMILFCFMFYLFTGNLIMLWAIAMSYKLYQVSKGSNHFYDNRNISAKSERVFYEDKKFWIPLYIFNLAETLIWMWQLVLFSDITKPDWLIF